MDIHILIVEDKVETADLLRLILENHKSALFFVAHSRTLSDALVKLSERRFNLVLLDLNLPPESEGIDTVVAFREQYPDIPIIIMTGSDLPITLEEQEKLKVSAIIRKPPQSIDSFIACIVRFGASSRADKSSVKLGNKADLALNVLRSGKSAHTHGQ